MSKLLFDEYPLIILPRLAVLVGLNEAIVLQQLNYWLQKSNHVHDGKRWIYNTYEQWQEQFLFWSIPTIKRAFTVLRKPYASKGEGDTRVERGALVLVARFNRAGFDKTNWWSIVYPEVERLEGMIRRWDQNDPTMGSKRSDDGINLIRPIPETTQRLPETSERGTDHLSHVLPSGRYKGKTLVQVLETDPGYVRWLADNWGSDTIRDAAQHLVAGLGEPGRWTQAELEKARAESLAEEPLDAASYLGIEDGDAQQDD